jgi:calcineurin-like phosphoesterase family protein
MHYKKIYTSDTHLGHKNIIRYSQRPFSSVNEMNAILFRHLLDVEDQGFTIVHLGDVSFDLKKFVKNFGWLKYPERHVLVVGNHDPLKDQFQTYTECFGTIIGTTSTWRQNFAVLHDEVDGKPVTVQVSHQPTPKRKVDYALYGHIHNNGFYPPPEYFERNPERVADDYRFAENDPTYINVCVELTDYKPKTLKQLLEK